MPTKKQESKRRVGVASVHINEDVWFYPNAKSFDFVVWVRIGDRRQAATFRVPLSKLLKALPPSLKGKIKK